MLVKVQNKNKKKRKYAVHLPTETVHMQLINRQKQTGCLCCVVAVKTLLLQEKQSPTAETAPSINLSLISLHCISVCAGDLVKEK